MTNREAAMVRWLAQIYFARGQLDDWHWDQFAQFIADHNLYQEPTPGRRLDGKNPWDALEIGLRERDFAEFETTLERAILRAAWDGKKYREITAIHRGDPPQQLVDQKS